MGSCLASPNKQKSDYELETERPAFELHDVDREKYEFVKSEDFVADIWDLFSKPNLLGKGASSRVYSALDKNNKPVTNIC